MVVSELVNAGLMTERASVICPKIVFLEQVEGEMRVEREAANSGLPRKLPLKVRQCW